MTRIHHLEHRAGVSRLGVSSRAGAAATVRWPLAGYRMEAARGFVWAATLLAVAHGQQGPDSVAIRVDTVEKLARGDVVPWDDTWTTFTVTAVLPQSAANVYEIFGTAEHPLTFPPAWQNAGWQADIGGVLTEFNQWLNPPTVAGNVVPRAQMCSMCGCACGHDSWLTVGIVEGDANQELQASGITFPPDWVSSGWFLNPGTLAGNGIEAPSGSVAWSDPVRAPGNSAAQHGGVTLAQITVPTGSEWSILLNMRGLTAVGTTWELYGVEITQAGSPVIPLPVEPVPEPEPVPWTLEPPPPGPSPVASGGSYIAPSAGSLAQDKAALLAMKSESGNSNPSSWTASTDPCSAANWNVQNSAEWYGLLCDTVDGRIVTASIGWNSLTRDVDVSAFAEVYGLYYLSAMGNSVLGGDIAALSSLTRLRWLDLRDTSVYGLVSSLASAPHLGESWARFEGWPSHGASATLNDGALFLKGTAVYGDVSALQALPGLGSTWRPDAGSDYTFTGTYTSCASYSSCSSPLTLREGAAGIAGIDACACCSSSTSWLFRDLSTGSCSLLDEPPPPPPAPPAPAGECESNCIYGRAGTCPGWHGWGSCVVDSLAGSGIDGPVHGGVATDGQLSGHARVGYQVDGASCTQSRTCSHNDAVQKQE